MKEKTGDLVEITWKDAFRFKGDKPSKPMLVKSWGKIESIDENGIALVQNEVQTDMSEQEIQRVMDGQFIPYGMIESVRVLK